MFAQPVVPNASLARTDSAVSFSSEDDASSAPLTTVTILNTSRRTRKRFTNVQLTMLENLFHQNSHPSREDREAVAKAGGMEIKSVTIWFQNKRQTERKTAASNNGHGNTFNEANVQPNITSTIHTFSLHNSNHNTSRTASPPFSVSSRTSVQTASTTPTSTASRPSLDRVASRSELRTAPPRTPFRRNTGNPSGTGTIYDNMPSSPLVPPPTSSPDRDYIDFGKTTTNLKTRRTLEWACAAARLADKDGYATPTLTTTTNNALYGAAPYASADAYAAGTKSRGRTALGQSHSHASLGGPSGHGYTNEHRESRSASVGSRKERHHHHHHREHREHRSRKDSSSRRPPSLRRREDSFTSTTSASTSSSSSTSTYRNSSRHRHRDEDMDVANERYDNDQDQTDSEEDHEAITPPSTWGKGDARWSDGSNHHPIARSHSNIMSLTSAAAAAAAAEGHSYGAYSQGYPNSHGHGHNHGYRHEHRPPYASSHSHGRHHHSVDVQMQIQHRAAGGPLPKGVDDDDMFKAALALCGLGARR